MMSTQPVTTSPAQNTQPQFNFQSAGGLLSTLQDLLPAQTGHQDGSIPPASLSNVLQSLQSSYQNTGAGAASPLPLSPMCSRACSRVIRTLELGQHPPCLSLQCAPELAVELSEHWSWGSYPHRCNKCYCCHNLHRHIAKYTPYLPLCYSPSHTTHSPHTTPHSCGRRRACCSARCSGSTVTLT